MWVLIDKSWPIFGTLAFNSVRIPHLKDYLSSISGQNWLPTTLCRYFLQFGALSLFTSLRKYLFEIHVYDIVNYQILYESEVKYTHYNPEYT